MRTGLKPNGRVYGSWGDVFRKMVAKGYDHGYAAACADLWEKRGPLNHDEPSRAGGSSVSNETENANTPKEAKEPPAEQQRTK